MLMHTNQDQEKKPSLVILFRSKLTAKAGDDYQAMNAEMETLVRQNPGFIDVKSYTGCGWRAPDCGVVARRGVAGAVEKPAATSRSSEHRPPKVV